MTDWDHDLDSLAAFPSERDLPIDDHERTALPISPTTPARAWRPFVIGVLVATLSLTAVQLVAARWNSEPATGGLTVATTPPGADVIVDGKPRGVTPLKMSLAPGSHSITVRIGDEERSVPVAVTAGNVISQYFELIPAVPPELAVDDQRAAAEVASDTGSADTGGADTGGADTGGADTARADTGGADRRAPVELSQPRATTGVGVSAARDPAADGWLTVVAPFAVQVMENGVVVGVSTTPRIKLSPGRHDLVLVNRALAYSEARPIRIAPGGGTMIRVDPRQ
jgi:hypothetical protein